ncbi:MAG: hypothetical protein VX204_00905 [Candidatus Thermoplasmatota archaeon]|nr:hypothetical protein [Candidatus Thermoplasmatota archaeon]
MNHIPQESYPTRAPVWWGRRGTAGPHPEEAGCTGRMILIRHPKNLSRLESLIARITKAPNDLRRPLDDMNSLLWELIDGTRTLSEINSFMNSTFHERIAPTEERVEASISNMMSLGLVVVRTTPLNGEWITSPLHDPSGELPPVESSLGILEEE